MMDEPSLGLALILVKVFDIIKKINAQGKTILLVEQNAFAALNLLIMLTWLEVGEIVLEGSGEELIRNPQVRRLISVCNDLFAAGSHQGGITKMGSMNLLMH